MEARNNISGGDTILMEDILIVDDRNQSLLSSEEKYSVKSSSSSSLSKIFAQSQTDTPYKYAFNDNISLTSLYDHVNGMNSNDNLSPTSSDSEISISSGRKKRTSEIEMLYESGSEDETFYDASPHRRKSSRCISPEVDIVDELIKVNILEKMEKKYIEETSHIHDEVVLLAGDSVLNEIDEESLSEKYKVEKVPFSRCSISEIITGLTPQLSSNPKYVILHLGNNENAAKSFESILEDLALLKSYVMKCLPSAYVLTCYPMARNDPRLPDDNNAQTQNILLKNIDKDSNSAVRRSNPYICATKDELLNLLAEKDNQIASLKKETIKDVEDTHHGNKRMSEDWTVSMYVGSFKELNVDAALEHADDVRQVSTKLREVFNLRMKNTLQCCNKKITKLKEEYENEVNKVKSNYLLENDKLNLGEYFKKLDEELVGLNLQSSSEIESRVDMSDPTTYVVGKMNRSNESLHEERSLADENFETELKIKSTSESGENLSDIEQNVIVRVKESIAKMFKKSDDFGVKEDVNVHLKLEALEEILEENYSKITDMTDKLNEKWSAVEEEMRQDFSNTLQKKEEEYGRRADKMVYEARVKMLRSISSLFVKLSNHHTSILNDLFLSSKGHPGQSSSERLVDSNEDADDSAENRRLMVYSEKLSELWKEFIDDENSSQCQLEPINEKMELRYCIEKNFDTIIGHMTSVVKEKYESFESSKSNMLVQFQSQLNEERERRQKDQGVQEKELESIREENEKVTQECEELVDRLRKEHKDEIERLKKEHRAQQINSNKLHKDELEIINKEHEEELEELAEQHREELQDISEQHQEIIELQKIKLQEMMKQHEEEISERSISMGSQVKAEHISKLRSLQQQYEDDHAEQAKKLSECRQEHRTEVNQLKNEHDEIIQKLRKDHADELDTLRKESADELHTLRRDNLSSLGALRQEHSESLENFHQENTERMENLKNVLQSEKMILIDEVNQLEMQTQSLEADMTLKNEELKEMTKLKENAETLLQLKETYVTEVEERMQYTQAMSQHTNDLLEDARARLQKERDQHARVYENLCVKKSQESEQELKLVKKKMDDMISKQVGDMERMEKEKEEQEEKLVQQQFRVNELEAELSEKKEQPCSKVQDESCESEVVEEKFDKRMQLMIKLVENLKTVEESLLQVEENEISFLRSLLTEMNNQLKLIQLGFQEDQKEREKLRTLNNNHVRVEKIFREKEAQLLEQIENQETELDNMKSQLIREKRKQMDIRRSTDLKEEMELNNLENEYSSELASSIGSNPDELDYRSDDEDYPDLPDPNRRISDKDLFIAELETARSALVTELKREVNKLTKKNSVLEREVNRKAEKVFRMRGYIKRQKNLISELTCKIPDTVIPQDICKLTEQLDECINDTSEMTEDAMSSITEVSEMSEDEENEIEGNNLRDEIPQNKKSTDKEEEKPNIENQPSDKTGNLDLSEKKLNGDLEHPVRIVLQEPINLTSEPYTLLNQPMSVEQMEKMLEDEISRRDEITNFLKRQETVLSHLEVQIGALKTKLTEKEEQFNTVREDFVRQEKKSIEKIGKMSQAATTPESADTFQANNLVNIEDNCSPEANSHHMEALSKLQTDFANATEERKQQISMLERNMTDQVKQTGELKDILKRQQMMVCELSQQLNKQKCITTLNKKEMGEVKESITLQTGADIPELRKELDEVKERSLAMESLLQTHIKKSGEKHEAMNTVRRLKQKLLTIEHKMINDEEEGERVTELVKTGQAKYQNLLKSEKPSENTSQVTEEGNNMKKEGAQHSKDDLDNIKQAWLREKEVLLSIIENMKKSRNERSSTTDPVKESESASDLKAPKTSTTSIDSIGSSCNSDIVSSADIVSRKDDDKDARVHEYRISSEFKMYVGKSSKLKKKEKEGETKGNSNENGSPTRAHKEKTLRETFTEKTNEYPEKDQGPSEPHSSDLERGRRLNTSLTESYTIVSQLDTFLTNEKKKIELINSRFDTDSTEKSSKCSVSTDAADYEQEISNETNIKDVPLSLSAGNKLAAKVKCLKAWEIELKKREKSMLEKEERMKSMMNRIEQGCDFLPQKEGQEATYAQSRHEDERGHTDSHPKKSSKTVLGNSVQCIPNDSIESTPSCADGQKVVTSGWTQTKVQRLYLKYFRAETFRKNLAYQKQYLTNTLYNQETDLSLTASSLPSEEKRLTFRTVVLAIISIRRMKYLASKYHRNLSKCSRENPQKDKMATRYDYHAIEEDISCSNESLNDFYKDSSRLVFHQGPPRQAMSDYTRGPRSLQRPPNFLHVLV